MLKTKLPARATPQQIQAIALSTIRFTFESDATRIGPIEPLPPDGWKTTYWVEQQQFEIEYTPRDGFSKLPIQ